jgi:hypothetical protein
MTVSINGTSGLVFNDATTQATAPKVGMVNRIINGAMVIDQRNAGASVTANDGIYTVDRWYYNAWQNGKGTIQRSSTAPAGFINSLLFTSNSAYSVGAGETFDFQQKIEGFNISDLGWGTANAQPVTLSFWVRSSLTGTFGGALQNSAQNRSYVFSYTINSANTWEQKSITIAGDTSGTWLTTNGTGILLTVNLGSGSGYQNTAGSWVGSGKFTVTGQTSVVGTNGATFYITGVQLEKGSTATSFDYRPYGTELALCQRYFEKSFPTQSATTVANFSGAVRGNNAPSPGNGCDAYSVFMIPFKVQKRASPTIITFSGTASGQIRYFRETGASVDGSSGGASSNDSIAFVSGSYGGSGSLSDVRNVQFDFTASAEL